MKTFCGLCGSAETIQTGYMPDNKGYTKFIVTCSECFSLTPEYGLGSEKHSLVAQISYHEELWREPNPVDLQMELHLLKSLVSDLKPLIGAPTPENLILEVGAGRGGLLKALLELGYSAKGFEPAKKLVSIAKKYYKLTNKQIFHAELSEYLLLINADTKYQSVILWHVFEHLEDPLKALKHISKIVAPGGSIIIQVPLLLETYIFPEHQFFMSHRSFSYVANTLGFSLTHLFYDEQNLYATAAFTNGSSNRLPSFMNYNGVPDPLSQVISLLSRSRLAYKLVADNLAKHNQTVSEAVDQHTLVISERDKTISALDALGRQRLNTIFDMENLVKDHLVSQKIQTQIIDDQNLSIKTMEAMIKERNIIIEDLEKRLLPLV